MTTTVQTGPGGLGTKVFRKDYPETSGLNVGTEKQAGRKPNLKYSETKVSAKKQELL